MSKRRRKKKKGMGTVIVLCLVIIVSSVVLVGLVRGSLTGNIKSAVTEKIAEKVKEQVVEQAVRQALESSGDPEAAAKAKEIIDNIDDADKKEMEAIVEKYADADSLSDIANIVGNGVNSESAKQIKEYLQENVSEEDIQKLQELYKKYEEKVP